MSTCTHPAGTECEHTRALQQWMRSGHGRLPYTVLADATCPLCRTRYGNHRIHGTDRGVCDDCLTGIPVELHTPAVTP